MVVDKGAFTLYVDAVDAVLSNSRDYETLHKHFWTIGVADSSPTLKIAAGIIPDNTLLRISGYKLPTLPTADTDVLEVDPAYVIARATGLLALMKDSSIDAQYWLDLAENLRSKATVNLEVNTTFIQ
jgi:hypothetical protein